MPWLDKILWKNPVLDKLSEWGLRDNSFAVATFARARMQERIDNSGVNKAPVAAREDLLTMFMNAQKARPEFMTDKRVLTMAVSMAFAGSETTAISLASVFYFTLKNPQCMRRLRDEIDEAVRTGQIEDRKSGLVSWAESQRLPYLDACIKEAFRMHPAAGLPLERVVPPQGIEICGHKVPGGTIVGCSAWVIHRREEIFGADVDVYRPERWLEADGEQLKKMNGTMFQFGAGSRTCIGKNISLMEIYKLVPSFLRRFEVSLQSSTVTDPLLSDADRNN
jgi:cytochrome P450